MGDQLVVDEPGAVHRLHHPTHRLAIHRHPPREAVQTVAIRGRREPVDQLPLIRSETRHTPTRLRPRSSPTCSTNTPPSPPRATAGSVPPTTYLHTGGRL